MSLFDLLTTLADVQHLIDTGQREAETLEYKTASGPLAQGEYREVAKDVSAFANSSGGLLIYGVRTSRSDRTLPEAIEPIEVSNIDTIFQVVSSYVRRPIPGLRWKTLPDGASPQVLLIDVPASPLAPHQVAVKDYRYYRRHGAQSEPMAHDLVELYFGRRSSPKLDLQVTLTTIEGEELSQPFYGPFLVAFRTENVGQRIARYIQLLVTVPNIDALTVTLRQSHTNWFANEHADTRTLGMTDLEGVLHPGLEAGLYRFILVVHERYFEIPNLPAFAVSLHADEMMAVQRKAFIRRGESNRCSLELQDAAV